MYVSGTARQAYHRVREIAANASTVRPEKVFVSRLSVTKGRDNYRGLIEEEELCIEFVRRGFTIIEPEKLSVDEQVCIFGGAHQVAGLGGAGMFNTVFCDPGIPLLDIESTTLFLQAHSNIFASSGLDYGMMVGCEDFADPIPRHKRWHLDVAKAMPLIDQFFDRTVRQGPGGGRGR